MKKAKHWAKVLSVDVPIYPVVFYLVMTNDVFNQRLKMVALFGEVGLNVKEESVESLCSYDRGSLGLFFKPTCGHGEIAHEIFHAVNRIMDYAGCESSHRYSEEAYAYLCEWITNYVYKNK